MAFALTARQLNILTYTVLGEAAGEGFDGMAAVAHVIKNRSESGRYSRDPSRVAKQPGQFSAWNAGAGGNNPVGRFSKRSAAYKEAEQAVLAAFTGKYPDPTGKALMYWAPRGMSNGADPYWADDLETKHGRVTINNHVFLARATPIPIPPGYVPEVLTLQDTNPAPIPAPVADMEAARKRAMLSDRLNPPLPRARPVLRTLSNLAVARQEQAIQTLTLTGAPRPSASARVGNMQLAVRMMDLGDDIALNPLPILATNKLKTAPGTGIEVPLSGINSDGVSGMDKWADDAASGMRESGNIDLLDRPVVRMPDGSFATVRSMSFQDDDGSEVLIPTISQDGRILSDDQAIALYRRTGQHLGKFDNPDQANRFAVSLHNDQERLYDGRAPITASDRVRAAGAPKAGLITRKVTTVEIDPMTGNPVVRNVPEGAADNGMPALQQAANREASRLAAARLQEALNQRARTETRAVLQDREAARQSSAAKPSATARSALSTIRDMVAGYTAGPVALAERITPNNPMVSEAPNGGAGPLPKTGYAAAPRFMPSANPPARSVSDMVRGKDPARLAATPVPGKKLALPPSERLPGVQVADVTVGNQVTADGKRIAEAQRPPMSAAPQPAPRLVRLDPSAPQPAPRLVRPAPAAPRIVRSDTIGRMPSFSELGGGPPMPRPRPETKPGVGAGDLLKGSEYEYLGRQLDQHFGIPPVIVKPKPAPAPVAKPASTQPQFIKKVITVPGTPSPGAQLRMDLQDREAARQMAAQTPTTPTTKVIWVPNPNYVAPPAVKPVVAAPRVYVKPVLPPRPAVRAPLQVTVRGATPVTYGSRGYTPSSSGKSNDWFSSVRDGKEYSSGGGGKSLTS